MSEQISRCGVEDYEELMRFLGRAFAKPTTDWFETNLSATYGPVDELMRCNYVVRLGGRIVACVGAFPIEWRVGGTTMRMRGLGGVSTDPDCRGKGYMRVLMDRVVADLRAEGWPLSWLGGQRQRYRYWGWERAGLRINASVATANLKHEPAWTECPRVLVEPMGNEPQTLEQVRALHDARENRCVRPADRFWHHMVQWGARPVVGRGANGEVVAYAVLRGGQAHVEEMGAVDLASGMGLLRSLVGQEGGVGVSVDQLPAQLAQAVVDVAEAVRPDHCGNWQVFDWCRTLRELLRAQHVRSPLLRGEVVLSIHDADGGPDQVVAVRVDDVGPVCEPSKRPADLEADGATMARWLLGPLKPSMLMPLPKSAAVLDQWCPLPATLGRQDEV